MPDEDEPAIELPDASNAATVAKAQDKARRVKDKRAELWRAVLADPMGRAEMWRLLAVEMHIFEAPFAVGPRGHPQAEATWFRFGQQTLGLNIYHDLMAMDADGVLRMLREHDPRFVKPPRGRVGG